VVLKNSLREKPLQTRERIDKCKKSRGEKDRMKTKSRIDDSERSSVPITNKSQKPYGRILQASCSRQKDKLLEKNIIYLPTLPGNKREEQKEISPKQEGVMD